MDRVGLSPCGSRQKHACVQAFLFRFCRTACSSCLFFCPIFLGGPIETVVDGTTGFLCDPTAQSFGSAIVKLARDPELAVKMGIDGQRRVHDKFSMEVREIIFSILDV